jgi:hypothetical protein
MSPEVPNADKNENIQHEQDRLDALDGDVDQNIDIRGKREELNETYIKRVNDIQGRLRDLFTKVDRQKDMSAPHWQALEATCFDVQGKLLENIANIDKENIVREIGTFNGAIDEFLQRLYAVEHTDVQGESIPEIDNPLVLASANTLRLLREGAIDKQSGIQQAITSLQERIMQETKSLGVRAMENDHDAQRNHIGILQQLNAELQDLQTAFLQASQESILHDLDLAAQQAQILYNVGRKEEANRLLFQLYEKYGKEMIEELQPGVWEKVKNAVSTLRDENKLTPFEIKLMTNADDAFQHALGKQKNAAGGSIDLLDQHEGIWLSRSEEKEDPRYREIRGTQPSFMNTIRTARIVPSERDTSLRIVEQPHRRREELGKADGGWERVLVHIGADEYGNGGHHQVVYRGPQGALRSASGDIIAEQTDLSASQISVDARGLGNVYLSPKTQSILDHPPSGYRVALRNAPRRVSLGSWNAPVANILTPDDIVYTAVEDGKLRVENSAGDLVEVRDVSELKKEREEHSRDVLRALDRDPAVHSVMAGVSTIQANLGAMGELLSAGLDAGAGKSEEYVAYARNLARPVFATLNNPAMKRSILDVRGMLEALRNTTFGLALGGIEEEIDDRIDALNDVLRVLEDSSIDNICKTILDTSFRANTWSAWVESGEAAKFVGSIVIATAAVVAAVALCVATFGAASPLVIAAAFAAGGIAGYELSSEAVYQYKNLFNEDVRTGNTIQTSRSRLGAVFEGQMITDPATGRQIPMNSVEHCAIPIVRDFCVNFAITLATIGLGHLAAGKISMLLSRSAWVQTMAENGGFQRMMQSMNRIKVSYEAIADKSLARKIVMESFQELGEETAEAGIQQGFNNIDARLGVLSGVIVVAVQGIRIRPRNRGLSVHVPSSVSLVQAQEALALQLNAHNHSVSVSGNVATVRMWNGEMMEVEFVADTTVDRALEGNGEAFEHALECAKNQDTMQLKEYCTTYNIDRGERIALTKALYGDLYQEGMGELVHDLHTAFPTAIDPEVKTAEIVVRNAVKLRRLEASLQADPFKLDADQAHALTMLTLDTGLAGYPKPPPPPARKPKDTQPSLPSETAAKSKNVLPNPPPPPPLGKPGGSQAVQPPTSAASSAQVVPKPPTPPSQQSPSRNLSTSQQQQNTHKTHSEHSSARPSRMDETFETGVESTGAALQTFDLFSLLKQSSYTSVRNDLAQLRYSDLIKYEENYNRRVDELDRVYQDQYPSAKPLRFSEQGEVNQYLFECANQPNLNGELQNKNAQDTAAAGYQLNYGKVVDASKSLTTFWFNPRVEQTAQVIKVLDAALQNTDAQVKVHVDGFTDALRPEARPGDKIVVYLEADNHTGINAFLSCIQSEGTPFLALMKPATFSGLIGQLKIPVSPGISFVERSPGGKSWDTTISDNVFETSSFWVSLRRQWFNDSVKPDEKEWRMAIRQTRSTRNRNMPGLTSD